MNAAQRYLSKLEQWDKISEEGMFADTWVDDVALAINFYLRLCMAGRKSPSFHGFMEHLESIAPSESEGENKNA